MAAPVSEVMLETAFGILYPLAELPSSSVLAAAIGEITLRSSTLICNIPDPLRLARAAAYWAMALSLADEARLARAEEEETIHLGKAQVTFRKGRFLDLESSASVARDAALGELDLACPRRVIRFAGVAR